MLDLVNEIKRAEDQALARATKLAMNPLRVKYALMRMLGLVVLVLIFPLDVFQAVRAFENGEVAQIPDAGSLPFLLSMVYFASCDMKPPAPSRTEELPDAAPELT